MKMYRCRICGETYLGSETPSRCPFCGAHAEHIVDTTAFPEGLFTMTPTEVERADLETAIETERSNARYYLAMARGEGNPALASAYKRLAKIEAEHCSVFCKLAGVKKPADLLEPSDASGEWCADIAESLRREQRASALYAEFAARTTSERLREVWLAVADVERDHIELDRVAARLAGCN